MTENASSAKTKVHVASKAVAALFVFALLCFTMSFLETGKLAKDDCLYPTWTSWKVKNYTGMPQRANLVFLGSSLVHTPMGEADADHTKQNLDATRHHKSLVFENRFEELTGNRIKTFSFALPGEMPSDAYLITKFLLKGERRPEVIVYGVGPRDFLENTLVNPSATDPFRYLSRFGDYSKHLSLIKPGWIDRLDHELGNYLYPYGKKEDLQTAWIRWTENLVTKALPQNIAVLNVHQRKKILPEYHPYEIREDEAFYRPSDSQNLAEFKDNLEEYRFRYKKMKWSTFNGQMRFYKDMLTVARDRGMHVVVVAMPITDMNKNLISKESWSAYHDNLAKVAQAEGATFIDLDQDGDFKLSDFADSVHLRASGGLKFFNLLANKLSSNQIVTTALFSPEPDNEGSRAVAEREDSRL